jgi:hypothetical protein
MKPKSWNIFWGVLLVVLGGLFLAQNFALIPQDAPLIWALIFAALSLVFFIAYFLSGVRNWGWLFPALLCGAIALTIYLLDSGVEEAPFVGAIYMWCVAIPFLVAFLVSPRGNWWALIPAWVMIAISLIILLVEEASGEMIGIFVQLAIALPFLVVFILNRKQWWALIPAAVFVFGAVVTYTAIWVSGNTTGVVAMFSIAVPFFVVYFWAKKNWWALIPAGVMASIGLMILAVGNGEPDDWRIGLANTILFFGMAATFTALYLRRAAQPTAWAKYPAIVLGIVGVTTLALGINAEILPPAVVIAFGGWLVWRSVRKKQLT